MTAKTQAQLQAQRNLAYTATTEITRLPTQPVVNSGGIMAQHFRTFLNALLRIVNERTSLEEQLLEDIIDSYVIGPPAAQAFVETDVNYVQTINDDVIYSTENLTVILLDPAVAIKVCIFRSITGTMTLTASTGTTETSSLTAGNKQTMGPRSAGWFNLD